MTPVVELQQVSSGVLRTLDVRAYPGERVGVIAEAGSGKTVLAELLVGVRRPRRGRVRREGRDVTRRPRSLELATAAPGVGWVAQPSRPFRHLSVYENVLVAASVRGRSHRLAEGHARRALERLGLEDRADRMPAGLAEPEAVRLDVARVVAAPRQLVVVDQLAERVDDATRRQIVDVLDESVAAGAALFWLERPDDPPVNVDRLLVLAYGRIAQEGPPEQVLATPQFRRSSTTAPRTTRRAPTATPGWAGGTNPAGAGAEGGAPPAPGASPAPGAPPERDPSSTTAPSPTSGASPAPGAPPEPDPSSTTAPSPTSGPAPPGRGESTSGAPPNAGGPRTAAGPPPGDASGPVPTDGEAELGAPGAEGGAAPPPTGARRRPGGRRRRGGRRDAAGLSALSVEGWTAPAGAAASIEGVGLDVVLGEVVAVVDDTSGPTSVLLASLAGLVDAEGTLWLGGREVTGASAAAHARAGLAFVPRDGGVADGLTVDEHLSLAGVRRWRRRWTRAAVFGLFPSLQAARLRPAGGLPALERRCLALARALVGDPQVVLVDEPVRGLASRSAPVVLQALAVVARTAAVVIAERPEGPALAVADRVEHLDDLRRTAPRTAAGAPR